MERTGQIDVGDPTAMSSGKLNIVHVADYVMPTMGYQDFMLAKWNARHGHEVHMITSDRYTPVPDYKRTWEPLLGPRILGAGTEEIEGVVIHRLRGALELRRRIWLSGFGAEIEKISPDVVLCHGTSSPLAFALPSICRRLGIPLLMDNHMAVDSRRVGVSGRLYYFGLRALTRKLLNQQVCLFLGVEQVSCDFMVQEQSIPPDKVELLGFGVDTDQFCYHESERQQARAFYGIPSDAKVVVQTGKLTRDKSPHWLAQAVAPIIDGDPKVWLIFVGAAPSGYVDKISGPLIHLNVAERLRFLPLVPADRLRGIFCLADVGVYPDASSLSCLEAASCQLPVIVADIPVGIAREEAGFTMCYQTGNISDLRQRIEGVLSDDDARRNIGKRARNAVVSQISYDAIARKSEAFMREAIGAHH